MTPKDPDLPAGEDEMPGLSGLPMRRPPGHGEGTAGQAGAGPDPAPAAVSWTEATGSGAIYDRVSSLLENGRLGEAEALLCRGLEIYPESVELLRELGVLYHLQGRYGKAARTFTRVMNITGEGKQSLSWKIASLSHKALAELDGPDPSESLATFDQILALEPEDREALAGKIAALRVLGRREEARRLLSEGLALDPPGASLRYQEGWLRMDGDRPDLAEVAFAQAVLADPAWPDPAFSRGLALLRLEKGTEALQFLREWVEAAGSPPGPRAMLGWFCLALHDTGKAQEIFLPPADREGDPAGLHGLAAVLLARGEQGDARVIMEKLSAAFPRDPLIQLNLGMVLARGQGARDLAEAAIAAKRALALAPRFAPAHSCLGITSFREGNLEAAMASLAEALRLGDPAGERNLGLLLGAAGRTEDAEARLRRAAVLDPSDARAWAGLGSIALGRGEGEAALGHLHRANLLDPRDAGAARGLALALARKGARQEAEEVIREALALAPGPERWALLLELAALLVSAGGPSGDPVLDDEARGILAEAGKLRPGDRGVLFYRAVVEARLGQPREAMDLLASCEESPGYRAAAHENLRRLRKHLLAGRGFPAGFPRSRTILAIFSLLQVAAAWFLFVAGVISDMVFLLLLVLFSALFALEAFLPGGGTGAKRETPPELLLPGRTFVPVPEAEMVSPLVRLRTALRPGTGTILRP
jgi:tetratricopeptide (TPR) repeat protein